MATSGQGFAEIKPVGGKPLINSIFDFSDDALGGLRLWLEINPPTIPISNIPGYSQIVPNLATVATTESTSSGTYADLATTGPTLTLPDGKYLLLYWTQVLPSVGSHTMYYSPSINGATAVDGDAAVVTYGPNATSDNYMTVMQAKIATVAGSDPNTVTMKYKTGANSTSFQSRALLAIRVSNA